MVSAIIKPFLFVVCFSGVSPSRLGDMAAHIGGISAKIRDGTRSRRRVLPVSLSRPDAVFPVAQGGRTPVINHWPSWERVA